MLQIHESICQVPYLLYLHSLILNEHDSLLTFLDTYLYIKNNDNWKEKTQVIQIIPSKSSFRINSFFLLSNFSTNNSNFKY